MGCACILAYITGAVDQELLLRNESLAAENRILIGPPISARTCLFLRELTFFRWKYLRPIGTKYASAG